MRGRWKKDGGRAGDDDQTEQPGQGVSRRLFLGTGASGVATAVVVGAGILPAGAATPGGGYVPRHPLTGRDPHAATAGRRRYFSRGNGTGGPAITILPVDRATFRVNATFDLRVEVDGVDAQQTEVTISITGPDGPAELLTGDPVRTAVAGLEVEYEGLFYPAAGDYTVTASVRSDLGASEVSVRHEVLATRAPERPAKNVIFFLGDGMGGPAVTAARILSKGMVEGKYNGMLEMDRMDYRGLVTTSGVDSIATDSANSMSAYMTGHKSSVNALGVYAGNNDDDANDHPRVENVTELLKRSRGMAIGVVTTAEVQDATPAAVFAHTRRRSEYVDIMEQALLDDQAPDVLLGGGLATLLPQGAEGSEREDDRNLVDEFRARGYAYAGTRQELRDAAGNRPQKLLGLFRDGNLNVYIDREITPQNIDPRFPDQPTLMEMTEAALAVLSRRPEGFFLMVEAASIDKMAHPLDGPRSTYDTIEFDQAIGIAKRFAAEHGDTLVVVTADHNHSMSIVGTHDRRENVGADRQANGVYADAGFPTYRDDDGDGFPDDPNPDIQLFFGWSNHPDHSDDFEHNAEFAQPALRDAADVAVDNPERDPGAVVQIGNLPLDQTNCVHTVEDVYVIASGPGAPGFNGVLDNTEVFHRMMDALGIELPAPTARG